MQPVARLVVVFGSVFASLALAACDKGGGAGGGTKPVALADFPGVLRAAYCKQAAICGYMPDEATCVASLALDGELQFPTVAAAVERGTIAYHADLADACIAQTVPTGCVVNLGDPAAAACKAMLEGQVAAGGVCVVDLECAGDARCTPPATCPDPACCAGTCVAAQRVDVGGACSATMPCRSGTFCQTTGTCAELIPSGASCAAEMNGCERPSFCDIIHDPQVCALPAADGAACDPGRRYACLHAGRYCDATALTCLARKAPGAACAGDECVGYAACVNGACAAIPAAGQACVASGDAPCLGSLLCTGGSCALPAAPAACLPP